ncbi:MAG: filamentous hemagglutinin N-terminal domain-containing protein [Rhodocyclaceae bacterium]|nr:filamentous hemagglutinin N-terminal domain-containing protein [Rhodocyclaceae bacterium]
MNRNKALKPNPGAALILALAVQAAFAPPARALPQGPEVAHGAVAISAPSAKSMQINAGNQSVINWRGFSIGSGESVRFVQPSAASTVLNRVTGQDASQILGQLQANGRVFLINPNGVVIGPGAVIDTAAFVASTLGMTDADFLQQRLRFEGGAGAGAIRNAGLITAGPGGRVALIAPDIQNSGIINTPDGKLLLAAGYKLEITSLDFEGVNFEVQAPSNDVLNLGQLLADGGAVQAFAGSLRHSGEIRAARLSADADGRVRLVASNELVADAASRTSAGSVLMQSTGGATRVAGRVDVSNANGRGGNISILGQQVALEAGARLDASGSSAGGQILVGGDYQGGNASVQNAERVYVGEDVKLDADARNQGDGGRIIVWANDVTRYYGSLSARGGPQGGNGGFAEVSGKNHLQFAGSADLSAPSGQIGNLLLDPGDILVASFGGLVASVLDEFAEFGLNVVTVAPDTLNNLHANVALQARRHIFFNSSVALTTPGAGLSAQAAADPANFPDGAIALNANISTSGGAVTLAGARIYGNGSITTAGGAITENASGYVSHSGVLNAGTGALNITAGSSISASQMLGGAVSLTAGSSISAGVDAATRVDANAGSNFISLYSSSAPLRVGTITGGSVYLSSGLGYEQAAGGSITSSFVQLYMNGASGTIGTAAAPINLNSAGISVYTNQAFHLSAPSSLALNNLEISGTSAALGASTFSGSSNLTNLTLGTSAGDVTAAISANAGLGSGLSLTVTDGGINASALNTSTSSGTLELSAQGAVTVNNADVRSLSVFTSGNAFTSNGLLSATGNVTVQTSGGNITTGDMSTGSGLSMFSSSGSISTGNITSSGNISLGSGIGSINTGNLSSVSNTNLSSSGAITVGSASSSNSYVSISACNSSICSGGLVLGGASGAGGVFLNTGFGSLTVNGAINSASSVSLAANNAGINLTTLNSSAGTISLNARDDIVFDSMAISNANQFGTPVSISSQQGAIRTRIDSSAYDIMADGAVSLSAGSTLGDPAFVHPLDIQAGQSNSFNTPGLSLAAGQSVGAAGHSIVAHMIGSSQRSIAARAGTTVDIAVQDNAASPVADSLTGLDLTLSASGIGAGNSARVTSQNLSPNIASDGTMLTLPDVSIASGQFDFFRLNASGGLNFGAIQLAGSGSNALTLSAGGDLTQSPGANQIPNGIAAGAISLSASGNLSTAGNITSSSNVSISAGNALTVGSALAGFGSVQAGTFSALSLSAGSDLHTANLSGGSNMSASAGGLAHIGSASTSGGFGDITISASDVDAQAITSSRSVNINSATLSSGAITAGVDATLDLGSVGTLATGNISAQRNVSIFSTGNLDVGTLQITAGSGTLTLQSSGNLTIGANALVDAPNVSLTAANALDAQLTGSALRNLMLDAGGTFSVIAAHSLNSLSITALGDAVGPSSSVTAGGGVQSFMSAYDGSSTTTLNLVTNVDAPVPLSLTFRDDSFSSGHVLVLSNLDSSGGSMAISAGGSDIAVGTLVSTGGNISISADNGSMVALGAGSINGGSVSGGATNAQIALFAENGAVGTQANPLALTNARSVAVSAHDDIGLTIDAAATNLDIGAAATGSGAIAIQAGNFPGFTLTRSTGDLVLGPVQPSTPGNFSLRATSGGIRVNGDINVNTLTLDAQGGNLILATGNARNIQSAGFMELDAMGDIIARAGSSAGQNVSIVAGNFLNLVAGHDITLMADGGSVTAAATGGFSQSAAAGNNILVQGGALAGAFAKLAANDDFDISAGGNISILGGSGSGAFAEIHGGLSSSAFQFLSARDLTVQGGSGSEAYASLRSGSQSMGSLSGAVLVAGGAGDGAYALIESTQGFQSIGTTSTFSSPAPTASVTVQGGSGNVSLSSSNAAYAAIRGNGQSILATGDIRVIGGSGGGASADLSSQASFQSIGTDSTFFNNPTDNIVVQAGTGAGAAASISGSNGQSVIASQDIYVLGANASDASASINAGGSSQQVGGFSTQHLILTAGNAAGAYAKIAFLPASTSGSQFVRSAQGISLTAGSGGNAYSGIYSGGNASQDVYTSGSLSLSGGTGVDSNTPAPALIEAANGTQDVTAASLSIRSGSSFASAGLTANGSGSQYVFIFGNIDIGTSAGANIDTQSGIAALGGGDQSVSAGGSISINNGHGANLVGILASGGAGGQTQTVQATILSAINTSASGRAGLHSDGDQDIQVTGTCPDSSCGIRVVGEGGGSAEISAGGDQTIFADLGGANPYAGSSSVIVGSSTALGNSTISAGGALILVASNLTVQGGSTAAAAAKVLAGGDIGLSTLTGGIAVLGGSAGPASIDPNAVDLVANGSIDTVGGGGSTATATISAGTLSMAATNGNIFVTGGSAPATIAATSTADVVASGDLAFAPNATDASLDAVSGGTVLVGGSCINCSGGLRGGSFSTNVIPVTQDVVTEVIAAVEAAATGDVLAATESSLANPDILNAQLDELNGSSDESTGLNRRGSQCR